MSLLSKIASGTSIGLAGTGAIGGALFGSQLERPQIAQGAAVGAIAGAAAIPMAGLALDASVKIGGAYLNAGAAAVNAVPGLAAGAIGFGTNAINGVNATGSLATMASPVRRHLGTLGNFSNNLVKWDGTAEKLSDVKMSGLGKSALWGTAIASGVADARKEMDRIHMGQNDGQITRATPRTPSYDMNAGATGDLVFALNANRRG